MADITHGAWIKDGKAVDTVYQSGVKVYGRNLLANTSNDYTTVTANGWGYSNSVKPIVSTNGGTYTASLYVNNTSKADIWLQVWINGRGDAIAGNKVLAGQEGLSKATFTLPNWQSVNNMGCTYTAKQTETMSYQVKQMMLSHDDAPYSKAPEDILN